MTSSLHNYSSLFCRHSFRKETLTINVLQPWKLTNYAYCRQGYSEKQRVHIISMCLIDINKKY